MYKNMTFRILHSKIDEFIERVPTGRIMNRFTKDVNSVDRNIIMTFSFFLRILCTLIAEIGFIV